MNISFGQQLTPAISLSGLNGNHWREDVWICQQLATGSNVCAEYFTTGGEMLRLHV